MLSTPSAKPNLSMNKRLIFGFIIGFILFSLSLLIVRNIECGVITCSDTTHLCTGVCMTSKERGWPVAINKQKTTDDYKAIVNQTIPEREIIDFLAFQI